MGRIMSYGYHTDVEKGRYYSPYGIYQEAEALLEALRELRTPEIKVCCPTPVIGMSLNNVSAGS